MPVLQSQLFRGDQKLEAAAVSDPAHIGPGSSGPHVAKIQQALNLLEGAGLSTDGAYGGKTAAAVLAYKKKRNIINRSYQTQADNIVGKMTVAALDRDLLALEAQPQPTAALRSRRLGRELQLRAATAQAPLALGASGPGVAALQDLLVDLGFLRAQAIQGRGSGQFGPETEAAVKNFQRRKGLPADGMVGPATLQALDDLIMRNPVLEVPDPIAETLNRNSSTYW